MTHFPHIQGGKSKVLNIHKKVKKENAVKSGKEGLPYSEWTTTLHICTLCCPVTMNTSVVRTNVTAIQDPGQAESPGKKGMKITLITN